MINGYEKAPTVCFSFPKNQTLHLHREGRLWMYQH